MRNQEAGLSTELQEQIRAFQEEMFPKLPQENIAMLQRTTENLVRSGIADRSLKKGTTAPDFSLPNVRGEIIKLSDLLARGPVVVAFYRGVW